MKEKTMKAKSKKVASDDMRSEYDFSNAVRGKYYNHVIKDSNVVVLEPDVAAMFGTSKAVNEALRNLVHIARETERLTKRPNGRGKKHNTA